MPITFTETDEVSNPTATYIYSEPHSKDGTGRLDAVYQSPSRKWSSSGIVNTLGDIFLPTGYPHSVSDDYLPYQIFDSLQAFCSSIAGLLSSRAVLQGVGVGNASASPTTALLLHILQDSSGRVATILFAHRIGTALEPECKTYRLAADVFNDFAMILDCLSPLVPAGTARVAVLSAAGVLRALCGVAGGSSKASLSAHFAKWGNIAEVNAKDSSQETIISLIGMLAGSFVVSQVTGSIATWTALLVLLALHLSFNYAAVRAVQMTSLNRQRANIVFSALFDSDSALELVEKPQPAQKERKQQWNMLTPAEVSKRERIFAQDGALSWTTSSTSSLQTLGFCQIGVGLSSFLRDSSSITYQSRTSKSKSLKSTPNLQDLTNIFTDEAYMLLFTYTRGRWAGRIVLKPGCGPESQLKAWAHALLAVHVLSSGEADTDNQDEWIIRVISRTLEFLNTGDRFGEYLRGLRERGWDLDVAALETRSGRRVSW